ncbi:MAG: peptidyl-tRNA hydrolase, partial [Candidatus Aenigmatarchaeota archaeon]
LKVADLAGLKRLHRKALSLRLPCYLVRDAGHTELRKGTVTCLGIGPDLEGRIDLVTGKLKML